MFIRPLEVFAAVYNFRSFTRAAEHLFLSQSAVSQSIGKLEEELGVCLFEREKKRSVPTPEADRLMVHVKVILEEWAEAEMEIAGKSREIKLYYYIRAAHMERNVLLAKLLRAMPELKIRQVPMELDNLIRNETWEEGNLYLVPAEFVVREEIRRFTMREAGHCLIMSEKNKLAGRERISLKDLEGQSLLLPGRFRFEHMQKALRALEEEGVHYHVATYAAASEVIPHILAFGGVAIMPDYIVNEQPGIVSRPLDDGVTIPIYLAYRGKPSAGIKKIMRYLEQL